jgi:hypothetical protein
MQSRDEKHRTGRSILTDERLSLRICSVDSVIFLRDSLANTRFLWPGILRATSQRDRRIVRFRDKRSRSSLLRMRPDHLRFPSPSPRIADFPIPFCDG